MACTTDSMHTDIMHYNDLMKRMDLKSSKQEWISYNSNDPVYHYMHKLNKM